MANETKQVFGSETTAITLTATVADAVNTLAGTNATISTVDNSTTLYPLAKAVLNLPDTFSAAPTAGSVIELYMQEVDMDGTTDEAPLIVGTGDIIYRAKLVGVFVVDNDDVAYTKGIVISMEGVKKALFHLRNMTGVTLSFSAGGTLKVTPFTYGPS
tara:strand:- start:607 stop:1080 length:474 start_codon:yes stop_codon:yes gene_type:complete